MAEPQIPMLSLLARNEDIAAFGGNDGKVYPGTPRFAHDQPAPFFGPGAPKVATTEASLVEVALDEKATEIETVRIEYFPLPKRYYISAGYSHRRNLWFVKGGIERRPLTDEEFMRGEV